MSDFLMLNHNRKLMIDCLLGINIDLDSRVKKILSTPITSTLWYHKLIIALLLNYRSFIKKGHNEKILQKYKIKRTQTAEEELSFMLRLPLSAFSELKKTSLRKNQLDYIKNMPPRILFFQFFAMFRITGNEKLFWDIEYNEKFRLEFINQKEEVFLENLF